MADEIGQEITETAGTAEDTGSPVEAGSGPTETAGEGNSVADQTATQQPSRAQERITKLIEERNALRAELEAAKQPEELVAKATKQAPVVKLPDDQQAHPALMGQVPDEDGQVVVNGRWVDAADLIEKYETKREIEELRSLVTSDQKARQQAELDAREQQTKAQMADALSEHIGEKITALLPKTATADEIDFVTGLVRDNTSGPLGVAYANGTLTQEFADQVIAKAIQDLRRGLAVFGRLQIEDNQQYKDTHKTRPGVPGEKAPPSFDKMTDRQRKDFAARRAAEVEKALSGG